MYAIARSFSACRQADLRRRLPYEAKELVYLGIRYALDLRKPLQRSVGDRLNGAKSGFGEPRGVRPIDAVILELSDVKVLSLAVV